MKERIRVRIQNWRFNVGYRLGGFTSARRYQAPSSTTPARAQQKGTRRARAACPARPRTWS